jgi:hypothetical protein
MTGMGLIMRLSLAAGLSGLIQTDQIICNILITPATHTGGMDRTGGDTIAAGRKEGDLPWPSQSSAP